MKKMIPLALCAVVLGSTTPALAEINNAYTPYIGLDYSYITAKANSIKPNYNNIGFNIGTKYNNYFGTEIFYQQSSSDSKKFDEYKFKSSFRAYGLDIAAYLPIGCYHNFDLIATAGMGEYVFKKKISGDKHHNDSGWGYRIGGGAAYNFDENLSLRIMARYVGLDKVSDFDHLVEYTAGIRYHFL